MPEEQPTKETVESGLTLKQQLEQPSSAQTGGDLRGDLSRRLQEEQRVMQQQMLEAWALETRTQIQAQEPMSLEQMAETLLRWISSVDPAWQQRIQALRDEKKFTALQAIASMVGRVLDHHQHLQIPHNPLFDTQDMRPLSEKRMCSICGEWYRPRYAGQPCCLKVECGTEYWDRKNKAAQGVHAL